jgi:hypothetical protein
MIIISVGLLVVCIVLAIVVARALDCFQEWGGLIFFGRHSLQIFADNHFYRKYWCTIT